MLGASFFRGLVLGLAVLLAPAPAHAAAPDRNATGTVLVSNPASLRKLEDLNFASLTAVGAGTATIDPNSDAMTTTGGVLHATGLAYAALFTGVSPTRSVIIIRLPRDPITITRAGGTETMTVDGWTLSGNSRRTVAAQEPFDFKVGATLHVGANQAEGLYAGTFPVEIQYP